MKLNILHWSACHHHVFEFCVIVSNNVVDTRTSEVVIRSYKLCLGNATTSVFVKAVEKTCEDKICLIHVKSNYIPRCCLHVGKAQGFYGMCSVQSDKSTAQSYLSGTNLLDSS